MDPNAALEELIEAILDQRMDDAEFAFDDLREWFAKGGFPPTDPRL